MPLQILLVDDNPGDIRLTQETFHESELAIVFHVALDGQEAMSFLKQEGVHALSPRPDIILLDLNLPKMDGREVLSLIKSDDALKSIPTIILTSSEADLDVVTSYKLQANCYLSKPVQLEAFQNVVKGIGDFWLTQVLLPRHDAIDEPGGGYSRGQNNRD